ncbi:cyclohexyl-isocyanide hydratase [Microdochium nivale]|nr:cyclohexyl-isocyanide hydratase [Microdochium nivale]
MCIFNNHPCTTHWGFCSNLAPILEEAAKAGGGGGDVQPGRVLRVQYVDSGPNAAGVQIISSGSISCGIDAALHVVGQLIRQDEAQSICEILDYARHNTTGVVTVPAVAGWEGEAGGACACAGWRGLSLVEAGAQ